MSDRSTLPQLQIPVLNGHASSSNQDSSRSPHLDALQEPESDSDSAMEESPVSDHGETVLAVSHQMNGIEATVPRIAEHLASDSPAESNPIGSHSGVDTPIISLSAVDSPMADSLADSSPAIDSSMVNSPAINSPAANSTVVDSPAINSPAVNSPAGNSPVVRSPATLPSELDPPVIQAPESSQAPDISGDIPA